MSLIPLYFNQQLTSQSLHSGTNIQNIGYNESTSSLHHRTLNESSFHPDMTIANDVSIFSTID